MKWWKKLGITSTIQQTSSPLLSVSLEENIREVNRLQRQLDEASAKLRDISQRLVDPKNPPTENEILEAEADLIEMQRELDDGGK